MLRKVAAPPNNWYPSGRSVHAEAKGEVPPVLRFCLVQLFVAPLKFSLSKIVLATEDDVRFTVVPVQTDGDELAATTLAGFIETIRFNVAALSHP